jgi:hypothetical protein
MVVRGVSLERLTYLHGKASSRPHFPRSVRWHLIEWQFRKSRDEEVTFQ